MRDAIERPEQLISDFQQVPGTASVERSYYRSGSSGFAKLLKRSQTMHHIRVGSMLCSCGRRKALGSSNRPLLSERALGLAKGIAFAQQSRYDGDA